MIGLKQKNVWCVYDKEKGHLSAKDGDSIKDSDANRLTDCATAQKLFSRLGEGKWPTPCSLALSLNAAGVIVIDLYNAWDINRSQPVDGAAMWLSSCNSYSELCHTSNGERAIRIVGRGALPEGAVLPDRVKVKTTGFITLTTQRIPARPAWQSSDDGGVIKDVTRALECMLLPKRPQYIQL